MTLPERIAEFFREHEIAPQHLVVAISGGPDSSALLLALATMRDRFRLTAAHVNHHLRAADSDDDESFAVALAARLGIELRRADGTLDEESVGHSGVEAAARHVRYERLEAIRAELGADFVATAHHRNDQAETVLLRLISGRGPARLAGIQPVTKSRVIRPFLDTPKSELDEFLTESGIEPRSDASNRDLRFVRNRIRHELFPLLERMNPRIVETLASTAALARLQNRALGDLLDRVTAGSVERTAEGTSFDLRRLDDDIWIRSALLLREIRRLDPGARDISARALAALARDLPRLRRTSVTRELEIVSRADRVLLRRRPEKVARYEAPLPVGGEVSIEPIGATIRLQRLDRPARVEKRAKATAQQFQLPPGTRDARFIVRNRRPGDRIRPLGLPFDKRVKSLLIDRKVPREQRDSSPILLCNNEIVWIAGVELSERFKVTDPDREAYFVTVETRGR